MLSAAHILAMDTKNLLDVCDSIRSRYPHIKCELSDPNKNSLSPDSQQNINLPQHQPATTQHDQAVMQEEFYENVTTAEEQLYCNQAPSSAEVGIYDNQMAIQEQLKIIEEPTSPVESQFSQKILSN